MEEQEGGVQINKQHIDTEKLIEKNIENFVKKQKLNVEKNKEFNFANEMIAKYTTNNVCSVK